MLNQKEILSTIEMIDQQHLDIRTITMGISLLSCCDPDPKRACEKIYEKITRYAENLVKTGEDIEREFGIPIVNKRISVTPMALVAGASETEDYVPFALALDRAARTCGVNFIGGYSALVQKGMTVADERLIRSIPEALSRTELVCSSVNVGSTKAGINMDAVALMGRIIKDTAKATEAQDGLGCAKLVVFCNAVEDNPFMAGAFHGVGEAEKVINVGVSGPGVVHSALQAVKGRPFDVVAETVKIGANCIYAKDILPPEFYRAVYAKNAASGSSPIYIIQNVALPEKADEEEIQSMLKSALDVLHGNGSYTSDGNGGAATYFIDISDYILAMTAEAPGMTDGYTYSGKYAEGNGAQGVSALIYDTLQSYSEDTYGYGIPIGIYADAAEISGSGPETDGAYDLNGIVRDNPFNTDYFFTCVSLDSVTQLISSAAGKLADKTDPYAYTFDALNQASDDRLLISGVGVSSANGFGNRAATTEKAQGQQTVALLKSADGAGVLCAVAADINDDWSAVSDEMYPYTVPLENNYMWQNVADTAQTTGFVALDAAAPEETGINLADDDRVQMMSLSSNESYFYITVQLLTEIDFTTEQFFIGIDTYQRNDGEYYYASEYTPTSLSGMEFVLRFDSKQKGGLYVVSSYDRSNGSYATKESYTGSYRLVSELTYGGFSSGDNQFYQTGSTVYIRIPWSWLNVTEPSGKIVINNEGEISGQAKTVSTNGAIVSVLIADKQSKDQLYLFPETKQDPAYKTYKWASWEKVSYTMREKESFALIKNYFSSK